MAEKLLFFWKDAPRFPLGRLLKDRRVSVRELARRSGLHRTLIQDYTRGTVAPSWRALCLIADALGLSLGDLDGARRKRKVKNGRG